MASVRDISKSGVGQAVEFQREAPNLFQMINQGERQKALKEQQEEAKKQAEVKKFNDFIEYDSPEFWQPFDKQIKNKYDEYQDFVAKARSEGKYTDPETLAEINKRKADIDIFAKKTTGLKTQYKENYDKWSKIPGIDAVGLQDAMMKATIKNEDGSTRSQKDVVDSFDGSLLSNEDLYDYNTVVKAFADNIAEVQTSALIKGGRLDEKVNTTAKTFVQLDDKGMVVFEDGRPKLNISEALVSEAMSNPAIATKIDRLVAEKTKAGFSNYDRKSALEEIIKPHSGVKEAKTWSTNQAYIQALRNKRDKNKGAGADEDFVNGLLKPWASLMQGKGWDGYEYIDGKDFKIASVPLNTSQIGDNEYIDKLYRDESGKMFYTSKDKDGNPLGDGEMLPFEKTGGLLSRMLNYSDKIKADERNVTNKWLNGHTDEFGNVTWQSLVPERTEVVEATSAEKYSGRINQFYDEDDVFDYEKLQVKMGKTPEEVVSNLSEILSVSGADVEVKLDSDSVTEKEVDLYVDGAPVKGYKNLDHESSEDMEKLFNYVKSIEVGENETKEAINW